MAHLLWYLDPLSPYPKKKNIVKIGPPLTKLSGSAHVESYEETRNVSMGQGCSRHCKIRILSQTKAKKTFL